MYLKKFSVANIRSVSNAELQFETGQEPGWHVILGSNGAGKSTLIKSFALVIMGEREAYAARQDIESWLTVGEEFGKIEAHLSAEHGFDDYASGGKPRQRPITITLTLETDKKTGLIETKFGGSGHSRSVWGTGNGWFSASFGPYRRFTGGDNRYDRLFVTNKRLAPHLTALGEDVALTDAMSWLSSLYLQTLQDEKQNNGSGIKHALFEAVTNFLNTSQFLPYEGKFFIDGTTVKVLDGNGVSVPLDELSDGYRSAMSLVLELIRQMVELYGAERLIGTMKEVPGTIQAPGVVLIDEIDVHLHPTWQRSIGQWLTRCFPRIQFLVTTHSPLICRAVASSNGELKGSIWKLPTPGSDNEFRRVQGTELDQLIYGDVLDAFSTELFGQNVTRSKEADRMLDRLAELNIQALSAGLSHEEEEERTKLRRMFPEEAGDLEVLDA